MTSGQTIGQFGQEDRKRKWKDNVMDGVESGGLENCTIDDKEVVAKCGITPVDTRWIGTVEAFKGETIQKKITNVREQGYKC